MEKLEGILEILQANTLLGGHAARQPSPWQLTRGVVEAVPEAQLEVEFPAVRKLSLPVPILGIVFLHLLNPGPAWQIPPGIAIVLDKLLIIQVAHNDKAGQAVAQF